MLGIAGERHGLLAGLCCLVGSATAGADDCAIVVTSASYTRDNAVAYQDEREPALFHVYEKAEPDSSGLRPLSRYKKIEVRYSNGHFAAANPEVASQKTVSDPFASLEKNQSAILQSIDKGQKVYSLFDKLKISDQISVDATVERNPKQPGEVISRLLVHCKDKTFASEYANGWIRIVSPIAGDDGNKGIAVIVDYCGDDGCSSEIDVLDTH